MSRLSRFAVGWVLALTALNSPSASAAFCALRDPVAMINDMYPSSRGHKSIVSSIGPDIRARVLAELPFTLHFDELGRHTLYVATGDDGEALGLVHVRSELVETALVEIAFAIGLDYRIRDLRFQRCRNRACTDDLQAALADLLTDRDLVEILAVYERGTSTSLPAQQRSPGTEALLEATLRSALKTLSVTRHAWGNDIDTLRRSSEAAASLALPADQLTLRPQPVSAAGQRRVRLLLNGSSVVDPHSVETYSVHRGDDEVGRLVEARFVDEQTDHRFRWIIDAGDRIRAVRPVSHWPDPAVGSAFESLVGATVNDPASCASAAEVAAFELTFLSSPANRATTN